jgi:hypothetical protein
VLAAVAAEGHAPAVSWEPGVSFGGWSVSNNTLAVRKGVKITLYARGVYKEMSIGITHTQ